MVTRDDGPKMRSTTFRQEKSRLRSLLCSAPSSIARRFLAKAPNADHLGPPVERSDGQRRVAVGRHLVRETIPVCQALERLLLAYHHQGACSAVSLDMDDARALLDGKRLYSLRVRSDSSARLPASMGRLIERYGPVFEAASGAVIVMTSGVDPIRLRDAGASWRTLAVQTPRDFKSIYATCTHPGFGRGIELVVILAASQHRRRRPKRLSLVDTRFGVSGARRNATSK